MLLPAIIALLSISCLEDAIEPLLDIEINRTAELLFLLEENGDFINSTEMPLLISAEQLYSNIQDYLIIDIRDRSGFDEGHIENAVSVSPQNILSYLQNNSNLNSKIVLVSAAGQSASYYTCLLKLYGYNNVRSLSFGMSSWHEDFSDIWHNALDAQIDSVRMDNVNYLKNDISSLPLLPVVDSISTPEDLLRHRISQLFDNTFSESLSYSLSFPQPEIIDNEVSIRTKQFYTDYTLDIPGYHKYYVICFGPGQLYSPYGFLDKYPDLLSHPVSSVCYQDAAIRSDFQSITHLQTLPTDKIIVVYSTSGHASAFLAAYLRILGYNARSILFGANSFVYSGMFLHDVLLAKSFTNSSVMNYPYRTGTH